MDQIKIQAIYSKRNSVETKSTLEGLDAQCNMEELMYKLKSTFDINDETGFKISMRTMMPGDPETSKLNYLNLFHI